MVCINIEISFGVMICHNIDPAKMPQNIYCLCTNMVEIGPTYFQKPCLRILGYISVVDFFFFVGCSSVFLFLASSPYTMYQKYKPLDKRLRQFFRQTGKETNKILIELFSLYAKLQHMHHVAACVKEFYSCFFFSRSQISAWY